MRQKTVLNPIRLFLPVGLLLCAFTAMASAEAIRILPMGDSDTTGHNHHASFRYPLYFLLKDAGYEVDFVGNVQTTNDGPNLDWYPRYESEFDPNHQGIWGARSDEMVGVGRLVANQYQPHIVLIQAGGNDILQQGAGGVVNAKFGIRDIVENIRSVAPGVTFLLGLSTPWRASGGLGSAQAQHVVPLNEMIIQLGPELDRPDSPVIVVDQSTGFDIDTMTQKDGVHQNLVGEKFIAENIFQVLLEILPDPDQPSISINRGHAGAWYDPSTSGQGQLIDVEEQSKFVFLSWFTFTPAGTADAGQLHWLTAQGNYDGNQAVLPIYETLGGRLDDPQTVTTHPVGEVTLAFNDCISGEISYHLDHWNQEDSFRIERAIPGSEAVCDQLAIQSPASLDRNDSRDGAWFDQSAPGQGFLIDIQTDSQDDDFIFLAWFTYGDQTASGQRWLTAQGPFAGSGAEITIYETTGGFFNDPETVMTDAVGSMVIEFLDCSHATVDYVLDDNGVEGTIDLVRLIPGSEALCEQLQ